MNGPAAAKRRKLYGFFGTRKEIQLPSQWVMIGMYSSALWVDVTEPLVLS